MTNKNPKAGIKKALKLAMAFVAVWVGLPGLARADQAATQKIDEIFSLVGSKAAQSRVTYTFATVPQFEQRKLFRIWRPILDELERKTGFQFKMIGTSKIPRFAEKVLNGDFDFAYMNPYQVVQGYKAQGYVPLIRDGNRKLRGVIVVPMDSSIREIEQLQGQIMAFPSPNALGASLLIRAELHKKNIQVVPKYVQTHSSVYIHVAKNLTVAGGGVTSTLKSQNPSLGKKLRILHTSPGVVPHAIVGHPRVNKTSREKIQLALLEMENSEKGRALLRNIPIQKAVSSSFEDYKKIRGMGLENFIVPTTGK